MTLDGALCPILADGQTGYDSRIARAIRVVVNRLVDPPAGSAALALLRFEFIHADEICAAEHAEACGAPGADAAEGCVSR